MIKKNKKKNEMNEKARTRSSVKPSEMVCAPRKSISHPQRMMLSEGKKEDEEKGGGGGKN